MWIAPPSTRLSFALALGCLGKDLQPDLDTWVSTAAASSTLSGKHTHARSWKLAWKKAPWMQRLYGAAISENSLPLSFSGWWIASLRASRAKTSASPENAPVSTARAAACSSTSSTLPTLAVRNTSFWRTSQASLLPPPPLWTKPKALLKSARPPESWENWPTAGGMRNGSLFQRPTWAPAMAVRGGSAGLGGVWTTPDVCSGARDMSKIDPELQKRADTKRATGLPTEALNWAALDCNTSTYSNGKMGSNIREQTAQWATPTSSEHTGAGHPDSKQGALNLRSQVGVWPTPWGTDGTKGGPNQAGSKGDLMLPSAAHHWTTPSASDGTRGGCLTENMSGTSLTQQVRSIWPTPAVRDSKGPNSEEHATVTGGGSQAHEPTSQLCGLFAPGPADQRWAGILASQPWLSPALSIEGEHDAQTAYQAAEPLLRGAPDGLAHGLDFGHRAQRLKCVGNGVVALQAATAFVVLARRAGFMTNQPLVLANIAQPAINSIAEMETI